MSTSTPKDERLVNALFEEIAKLRDTHPDFFAYMEDVDPDTAPRAELLDMISSAPTPLVRGYLFGKFTFRLNMLENVTGRPFL